MPITPGILKRRLPLIPISTNTYYDNGTAYGGSSGSLVLTANRLYAVPIFLEDPATLIRLAINLTAFVANNARLGIYRVGSDGRPGSLILDAGQVATTSNGFKPITISQALGPGFSFLAVVSDGTSTIAALTTSMLGIMGMDGGASIPNGHDYAAHTYGALPDPFPSATRDKGPSPRIMFGV